MPNDHKIQMMEALAEAKKAGQSNEVPVGAIVVAQNGEVLSAAHNRVIASSDPTAHAEILALRAACRKLRNYRLSGVCLYVTVEPCPMCLGAMIHARVQRLVFGTHDPKWGAAGSLYNLGDDARFNHRIEIVSGVCAAECRQLIQDFFRSKRG